MLIAPTNVPGFDALLPSSSYYVTAASSEDKTKCQRGK